MTSEPPDVIQIILVIIHGSLTRFWHVARWKLLRSSVTPPYRARKAEPALERMVAMSDFGLAGGQHSERSILGRTSHRKDLQSRHGSGLPGVVVSCCFSALECPGAVACSEVPAFRYEFALSQVESQTVEPGTSIVCDHLPVSHYLQEKGFGGAPAIRRHRTLHRPGKRCRPRRCSLHRRPDWEGQR
jgi:hypothetical protein